MHIVIPDDYQDAVRQLDCFRLLDGHIVTIYTDHTTDVATLATRFQTADALVLIRERTPITATLLEQLPRLRLISQTGRGIPHIALDSCTQHGIAVAIGGGEPIAPAELTWALIMATMRHLPQEVAHFKAGGWQKSLGRNLHGRRLGILGYGTIGRLVAQYARAFGMQVLVWGREGSQARATADGLHCATNQRELFAQSDVLSVHLKLNAETRGIITADDFAVMPPEAVFINTSRAELVADGALLAGLRVGYPAYAGVDVYESEPALHHPLLQLDNVICTPHLGYVEQDTYESYFGQAFQQILDFFAGKTVTLANPHVNLR